MKARPTFVLINGRYVRDTRGKEIVIHPAAKGNSLSKFPRVVGRISHHRWA
jgi:hypothetical protein